MESYLATEESDHADQFPINWCSVIYGALMSPQKALEDMPEDGLDGLETKFINICKTFRFVKEA